MFSHIAKFRDCFPIFYCLLPNFRYYLIRRSRNFAILPSKERR
nr:MAG TPA: hypothetical protein [Caudoviricetes sp.]